MFGENNNKRRKKRGKIKKNAEFRKACLTEHIEGS